MLLYYCSEKDTAIKKKQRMLLALGKSNIEQNIAKYYEAKTTINM